jgi:heparanase 1
MVRFWKTIITGVALAMAVMPQMTQAQDRTSVLLDPATMKRVGIIDDRYQSYNVEMLEVTGGKFWKPYKEIGNRAAQPSAPAVGEARSSDTPSGMSADLYQYRSPLDLTNRRLRAMAKALGPAYMRISGTWANTTYFADTDTPPSDPPQGYGGVLTRKQWLAAIDFSRAVDAPIVTSMPTGTGTRAADGLWRPDQGRRWLAFTEANGGAIAAVEFMNEPTLASMGGAPKGYDAVAFGRDFRVFDAFIRKEYPGTKILAPGSVGETNADWAVATGGYGNIEVVPAADLAASTGDADAFSYHHYGAASQRCAAMGHQTSADQALSEEWLDRTDQTLAYYRGVRDRFMPTKRFWNTETADAACGGNPWAGTFLDTFRYLDQLGRLARQEVDVVIHNTLVASDYGLLDENSFEPKPNFWGALLWRRLMGPTVLDAGFGNRAGMHVYAHCLRGVPGGVAVLVLITDRHNASSLALPDGADRYTLSAASLTDKTISLNGAPLQLGPNDALPPMAVQVTAAGQLAFAPASITLLAIPSARNEACR